jgi:hypothetical protein
VASGFPSTVLDSADVYGNKKRALFWRPHTVEKIGHNRYTLFNNGATNKDAPKSKHSTTLMEIVVDDESKEVAQYIHFFTLPIS